MAESNNRNINAAKFSPHVSALVNQFIPENIRVNHPKFVQFVQVYLNYLETQHGAAYYQNTLPQQRNLDTQDERFLRQIENEIGLFAPRKYLADPRIFYNEVVDLWRSKGSEEAIKTFFRLFLDDPVEVRYPWDYVLKPSDGRWIRDSLLRVTMIRGNGEDFVGQKIRQLEEFGEATVTKVERKVYADGIIFELYLVPDLIVGNFREYNTIVLAGDVQRGPQAEIYRSVSGINVVDGGSGFQIGDQIKLGEAYNGFTFTAFVDGVDEATGAITSVSVSDFGSGNTPIHVRDGQAGQTGFFLIDFDLHRTDALPDLVKEPDKLRIFDSVKVGIDLVEKDIGKGIIDTPIAQEIFTRQVEYFRTFEDQARPVSFGIATNQNFTADYFAEDYVGDGRSFVGGTGSIT